MKEQAELTGVVLSSMPVGEYDKRVVILTRERGKIHAFARRARKAGSPLMAATNPFVFAKFTVIQGRDAYTLIAANVTEYFADISFKTPEVYYGFYFLEIADYYGHEYTEEQDMVNLIYISIRTLLSERIKRSLVKSVYEIKAVAVHGDFAIDDDIPPSLIKCLSYILYSPIKKLFSFTMSEELSKNLSIFAERLISDNVDRKLNSLLLIKQMESAF